MRTETLHQAREYQRNTPQAGADGTSTIGHRSPPLLPHHAVTDPIASCLAAAETDSAADQEEPHPTDFEALRRWLESEDLWAPNRCKPQDPKDAMRRAMEEARLPKKARRSSSKFHDLATAADFTDCDDPGAFPISRSSV